MLEQLDEVAKGMDVIYNGLLRRTIQLSIHKFSSNIIEKCLQLKTPEIRKKFTEIIFQKPNLAELIKNKFGNFVLVRALNQEMPMETRAELLNTINAILAMKNMEKYRAKWNEFMRTSYQPKIPPNLVYYNTQLCKGQTDGSPASRQQTFVATMSTGSWKQDSFGTASTVDPGFKGITEMKKLKMPQSNDNLGQFFERKGLMEDGELKAISDRGVDTNVESKRKSGLPSMLSKIKGGKSNL